MNITVDIQDKASPAAKAILASARSLDFLKACGRGVAVLLRAKFQDLENTRPNKQGWPRQHFWSDVRRSVQNPEQTAGKVSVSITHPGIALRYFGGDIFPVNVRFLTIPAVPEAYGKRAREFDNLRPGYAPNEEGRPQLALVETDATVVRFGRKKKDGTRTVSQVMRTGGQAVFWLVTKAHQEGDKTILPTEDQMQIAAVKAGEDYLQAIADREDRK